MFVQCCLSREIPCCNWINRMHLPAIRNLHEENKNLSFDHQSLKIIVLVKNALQYLIMFGVWYWQWMIVLNICYKQWKIHVLIVWFLFFPYSTLLHHSLLRLPVDPLRLLLLWRTGWRQREQMLGKNAPFIFHSQLWKLRCSAEDFPCQGLTLAEQLWLTNILCILLGILHCTFPTIIRQLLFLKSPFYGQGEPVIVVMWANWYF